MKVQVIISTTALLMFLGMSGTAFAQQDKHEDQAKPEQQHEQAKPAQQQEHTQQPQQHTQQAQQQEHTQQAQQKAKSAQQEQHSQQAQQQQHAQQVQQQQHNQQAHSNGGGQQQHPQRTVAEQQRQRSEPMLRLSARGNGHIPDDRFHSNFGRQHSFRISQPVMVGGYSRFQYGGFWFGFVQPWPAGWYYTDDVYVDYYDGGYYLYNPYYPGSRISISVVL
jgi:hypothetical protein